MSDTVQDPQHAPEPLRPPDKRSVGARIGRLFALLLALGGGAAGYWYYKQHQQEKIAKAKKEAEAKRKPQVTLVRTARTRAAKLARKERYVGELAALRTVELAAKVPGRIVRMTKELGQSVKKGEVVAWLDDADIVKQIDEAKAAVDVANASIERAKAELDRAEAELKRKKPLYDQQLVTRQEWENLEAAVAVARASLSLARAQLLQATTRVRTLEVALENTRVVAPFAGRINKRYVDPGTMVSSLSSTPIYQLVSNGKLLARFKVPERDLSELPKGKKVTVSVEAYPAEVFEGKVVRVSPAVEVTTRTLIAEAELDSRRGKLRPGMFARVDVIWSVADDVVLAPARALVRPPDDPQGKVGVFVHEKGLARFQPVQVGREEGDEVEVRGVGAGVEVITEGQHGLKTGAQVKVDEKPKEGPAAPAGPLVAPKNGRSPAPSGIAPKG